MSDEKICFVISPIGESESETRKRADQVLKHVIRPAVSQCGYKAIRADEIDKPGLITSQVIQHVVADPLVIADLTERNPNVFYELAIRHALRKPLVQIIKKGDTIPFDVAGTRTIYVDHKDLDSVDSAKNDIIEQIKSLEKDSSSLETPISVSLDLQILRQSEKPEERSLADLIAAVAELRASLAKVESRIGTNEQKGMLDQIQNEVHNLSYRLQDISDPKMPWSKRGRLHPQMLNEIVYSSPNNNPPALRILIIASMFRDAMPWVYELGIEAYRQFKDGPSAKAHDTLIEFRSILEASMHGPWARDLLGRNSKEQYHFLEEISLLIEHSPFPEKESLLDQLKKNAG